MRNVWDEPLGDMTDAIFERVMAGLRELPKLRELVFGGYGEPFAHPHILDLVAAVKGLGLKVTVSTNGTLLDEGVAEERLAQIRAPIGLDLGDRSPAEIALAILAEVVQMRYSGTGASWALNVGETRDDVGRNTERLSGTGLAAYP